MRSSGSLFGFYLVMAFSWCGLLVLVGLEQGREEERIFFLGEGMTKKGMG
jgi:hypothetical protein